jgi:type I restriction enzyme S subunit
MSFSKYEKYKDSGVEWLGEVPEHWEVTALKRGFSVTLGKMLQPEQSGTSDVILPYLRAANIQWGGVNTFDIKQMWLSPRDRNQLRLVKGDLLISEGGDVGRSCIWQDELDECYFQNSVNRVRARKGNSNQYLYYWMCVIKDKGYVDVLCNKSTIAHFTAEKVAEVPVPFPLLQEQVVIASFLDRETAKIDELVAEQQRLIELLKEKRQAVISHAVTRGLNPNVKLKPSGIEWLGDVPEHWEVKPLKSVASFNDDVLPESYGADEEIEYVDIGSVSLVSGIERVEILLYKNAPSRARRRVRDGDVIVSTVRTYLKAIAPVINPPANMIVSTGFAVIRPRIVLFSRFAKFVLQANFFVDAVISLSTGVSYPAINVSEMEGIAITMPSLTEQTAIADFLDSELAKLDILTTEAKRAIDLLQERRTALISAAVTGKIDVRQLNKN